MTMNRIPLVGLAVLAIALAGCSDSEPTEVAVTDTDTDTPSTADAVDPTTDGEPAVDPTTDEKPAGDTVEITAVDYAFEGVPETVPVGTELTLTNTSEEEVHEMVVFRVDDDQTMSLDEIVQTAAEESDAPPPEWLTFAGVGVAPPGQDGFAPEGPVVLDEPGRYILLCFIPTGADPAAYEQAIESGAEPQVDGGPPHVAEGMAAELTVE